MSFIVAIDGPAGTGKGTITKLVAERLNFSVIDTGAIYRAVSVYMLKNNIKLNQLDKINIMLKEINIQLKNEDGIDKVFLNMEDITDKIRTNEVNEIVSQVSHIVAIRENITKLSRKMAEGKNIIMEGRDIGTNVFPNAEVKIYLDASVEERVKRRMEQNKKKNIKISYEDVKKNIEFRDNNDKTSKVAPLKQAEDAVYLDTTKLSIKQVEKKVLKIINKKRKINARIEKGYIQTPDTLGKRVQKNIIKFILGGLYKIIYRPRFVGLENLPKDEGYIICSNHVNYLDAAGYVLCSKFKIRFIGKADLLRFRILSYLARTFDIIPVKRDTGDISSIKICLKALKNKDVLGIFPEGTRHGMEKNVEMKNGAVYLAEKAKVKIVPAGVQGSFKPFTKVTFNYGKPIDVSEIKKQDQNWQEKATEKVMNDIIMLTKKKV